MRRLLAAIGLSVFLATGLVWTQTASTIVVLHTNDMHGQILPRDGIGGLAEMATLMRRERADFVLDGGDMFTGTMISDEFLGKPLIEILNRLNYRAVALGNHEFDYGLQELGKRAREANFPILSANVVTGIEEIKPFTVLNVKGVRIGVIGLTVETLREVSHPKNLTTVTVKKVVDAMQETLPKVRPLSDFVILVTHITFDEQIRVAKAFPEVKLIVTGHPHIPRSTQVGSTLIVETGNSTRFFGKVEMRFSGKTPESMTSQMIPVRDVEADPEIKAIIDPYHHTVMDRAAERLGEAEATLEKSEIQESALNNMVADAIREYSGSQIAIQNVGGIRAPILKGPITYGDVFEILPFQNTLVTMTLSGAQLKQMLGRRVVGVSGLKVSWDITRTSPNRLVSATLFDGTPLVDAAHYSVAISDFLAVGGDGLVEFMLGAQQRDTGIMLREIVRTYLRKHHTLSAKLDGRVTIKR